VTCPGCKSTQGPPGALCPSCGSRYPSHQVAVAGLVILLAGAAVFGIGALAESDGAEGVGVLIGVAPLTDSRSGGPAAG